MTDSKTEKVEGTAVDKKAFALDRMTDGLLAFCEMIQAYEAETRFVVLRNERDKYFDALDHIAFKPLTDDPEASEETCLNVAISIARTTITETTGE